MFVGPMRAGALSLAILFCGCSAGGGSDTGPAVDAGPSGGDGGGAVADAMPAGPTCPPGETAIDNSALVFDGVDDGLSMGVAPSLGLSKLTVEAWVRREGTGVEAGTGKGGVRVVPIAGKGRGEDDQGNHNCNYAFGFHGGVLAADFEDNATGGNHPIIGKTAVPWGEWHHVAATYDGTTWRLYVDGVLDVSKDANATPRADSIQHFGIATTFDSAGTAAGQFAGAMDEVRVWNYARTEDQIKETMYRTVASAEGLVGRWALDSSDTIEDTAGDDDGTASGGPTVVTGAVLDRGLPPTLSAPAPDGDNAAGSAVDLSVAATDPEGNPVTVRFYARPVSTADDFTIVVLPDTQNYTKNPDDEHFYSEQTQWIVDNREAYNIVGVIHNGDIINNWDVPHQWDVADKAMKILEAALPDSPDGVPYGITLGNHDLDGRVPGQFSTYDSYFGVDRFLGRSYYGGHFAKTSNSENWVTFSAGGLEFVVVDLSFDPDPSPAVIQWAKSIFEAHPNAFGILNTHFVLGHNGDDGQGKFSAQANAIYQALKNVDNVQLMTGGHVGDETRRTDVSNGNVIHSMLADYQFLEVDGVRHGGSGYLRIWEFSPANDELTVRSYSPTLDKFFVRDKSEFTLPVDLPGAGAAFSEVATVDASAGTATTPYTGLEAGEVYEWYATASDCDYTVRTPIYRFTAAP